MGRVLSWLQHKDRWVFVGINGRMNHALLDLLFTKLTHLGGASFTIAASLAIILSGHDEWRLTGWQSLIALAVSHVPVFACKKMYPRSRPYMVIPGSRTFKKPLKDHSFPSGHTTAIFATTFPLMLHFPFLAAALLPLALCVGLSRIYLGLHYPSDCLAGAVIGSGTATVIVAIWA